VKSYWATYLCRVHLELADHFDGHFGVLAVVVLGAVDVAESAVAHLLDESVSLQTRVARQLALALTLLGDNALKDRVVVVFLLTLALLLIVHGTSGCMASFGGNTSVIYCGGGVVLVRRTIALERLVGCHIWLTDSWCGWRSGVATSGTPVLLCVDIGHLGGGLGLGRFRVTSLLAVPDEVLEILYSRHRQTGVRR
jgi:hypothetical protein